MSFHSSRFVFFRRGPGVLSFHSSRFVLLFRRGSVSSLFSFVGVLFRRGSLSSGFSFVGVLFRRGPGLCFLFLGVQGSMPFHSSRSLSSGSRGPSSPQTPL